MSKSLLSVSAINSTVNSGLTRYNVLGLGAYQPSITTEAQGQVMFREAGTLSLLHCMVRWNNLNTGTSTFKVRKNTADGNEVVSITYGVTGGFQDTTHTDSVAGGDLLNYQLITSGASGSITITVAQIVFEPTDTNRTLTKVVTNNVDPYTKGSDGTTYLSIEGKLESNDTENSAKYKIGFTGIWKGLYAYVVSNTRTTTTTIVSRKNNGNGVQTVSISTTATGVFEDTTNTDTLVATNSINYAITCATGSGSIAISLITSDIISTDGYFGIISGAVAGRQTSSAANTALYLGGSHDGTYGEWWWKSNVLFAVKLSNFVMVISSNSLDGIAIFRMRKNETDTNVFITVPAGTTGTFEDTLNSDSYATNDYGALKVTTGGTSGTIWLTIYGFKCRLPRNLAKIGGVKLRPMVFAPGLAR